MNELAQAPPGPYASPIEFTCAQVPEDFGAESEVWVWLGSDNNKGAPTEWRQGIRALARCETKEWLSSKSRYKITLGEVFMLPRTVEKLELLTVSPVTYANELSQAVIVGLNNYASQVVQLLTDREFATIAAIVAEIFPDVQQDIFERVPGADGIQLIPADGSPLKSQKEEQPLVSEIDDGDPVLQMVRQLVVEDGWGGVIFTGVPATGKSWYARQIGIKLADGDRRRFREVQFHPSYQYEDFVEGYVPDGNKGFRLADKHMLEMAEIAFREHGPVVLVIDEFSRTDPARVLGETMTYMEGSLRGIDFYLPSGRRVNIPKNLIFLATMNPEDRSVDEIDAAMERRWAKIALKPDAKKVRDFLQENAAPAGMIGPVLDFFNAVQKRIEIGHAYFRTVKDPESAVRLWNNQLQYVVRKRFRFDADTQSEIEALWTACETALKALPAQTAAAPAGPKEVAA